MLPPLALPRFVPDPGLGPILFPGYDKNPPAKSQTRLSN